MLKYYSEIQEEGSPVELGLFWVEKDQKGCDFFNCKVIMMHMYSHVSPKHKQCS